MQLPANASIEMVPELLEDFDRRVAESEAALRIDAQALAQFDTATLALLLHAQRRAKEQGRSIEIVGAPPKLLELARLYGVDELLPIEPVPSA
jgi:phospholipid transport system transporter-binding protein